MNYFLVRFVEQYLFFPNIFQKLISVSLFPITIVYCIVVAYKRLSAKAYNFGLPVVSIGNLIVGGSGKTPITIALINKIASNKKTAVVLRGHKRGSVGMQIVKDFDDILCDVNISGDEAMLLAKSLPNSLIIVAINRDEAILKAKEMGTDVVFLDDGYSKHHIKKFDILLRPKREPENIFCLPSGGYRETKMMYSFVDLVLKEDEDFKRVITFKNDGNTICKNDLPQNILLLTSISKPQRLFEYLPKGIKHKFFEDHHNFSQKDIDNIHKKYKDYTILTTGKDKVKLDNFDIKNIILMDLDIEFTSPKKLEPLINYISL